MLLAPLKVQPSRESLLVARAPRVPGSLKEAPCPSCPPPRSDFLPPRVYNQPQPWPTAPSAVTPLTIPLPALTSPSPPAALLSPLSPQAICDTSSVQILTYIFCPSMGPSKSLISLNRFFMLKAFSADSGSTL